MVSWKKIDTATLVRLRQHYLKFEPYCNLNIVDMWSYRAGANFWFQDGDTVVYRLNDYNDDSLYVTILGKKSTRHAIKLLCSENKDQKKIILKCVPEITLKNLGDWDAIRSVQEDNDNHDYIFDVKSLVDFSSPQLTHKYPAYLKLKRKHPHLAVKLLDYRQPYQRKLIYKMFHRWVFQTSAQDWHKEYLALKRALNLKQANLVCLGFFDGNKIIGYTINEPESNGYYQAFFGKSDRNYPGLGLLMEHETAKYFGEHNGSKFMNLQPDQGIEGLRQYKTSMGPIRQLKKYTVVIDTAKALS